MKTSITKLKSSLLFSLAVLSFPLLAKPVAQVTEVKGQVFLITPDGKTKSVKVNDHLEEKSEMMVGEDGNITLNDYYDATYHMIEGSHIKFFDKSVQLKQGKTWIQSTNSRHPLSLTTANGNVDFWKGEFITTFDQGSSKTQVLVVNGEVEVSNILDRNLKHLVQAGNFTLVDPDVGNGEPRSPTKVGLTSLNQSLAEFNSLPEKLKKAAPVREIASVPESKEAKLEAMMNAAAAAENKKSETVPAVKKGEIVFMKNWKEVSPKSSARVPASVDSGSALNYFKKKVTKTAKPVQTFKLTTAPIRFYGVDQATPVMQTAPVAPRLPASVAPVVTHAAPKKVGSDLNVDADFSESLRFEKANQPKHSKELENLIQDLKSY